MLIVTPFLSEISIYPLGEEYGAILALSQQPAFGLVRAAKAILVYEALAMTLPEVNTMFSTDEKCRELLERLRWPEGVDVSALQRQPRVSHEGLRAL